MHLDIADLARIQKILGDGLGRVVHVEFDKESDNLIFLSDFDYKAKNGDNSGKDYGHVEGYSECEEVLAFRHARLVAKDINSAIGLFERGKRADGLQRLRMARASMDNLRRRNSAVRHFAESLKTMPKPIAVSVDHAKHMIGLGKTKIYDLINQGELDASNLGDRRVVWVSSIERYLEKYKIDQELPNKEKTGAALRARSKAGKYET